MSTFFKKLTRFFSGQDQNSSESDVDVIYPFENHNILSPIPIKCWNTSLVSFPEPTFVIESEEGKSIQSCPCVKTKMSHDDICLHQNTRKSIYPWTVVENRTRINTSSMSQDSQYAVPPNTPM